MDRIEHIAAALAESRRTRAPYEWLTGEMRPADLDEAYAVQRALQRMMVAERGPIAGRKIALTSKAMQEMVGLDTSVVGAIFAREIHHTPATVRLADFHHLGLEYELAFELARDVAPGRLLSPDDALALVGAVRPAFELVDDRHADYSGFCGLTLAADNAWCGGIVLGTPVEEWRDLDVADLPAVLHQDGMEPEEANTGAADPVASLAFVLNHMTAAGDTVRAGEHVITGSVLRTRFPSAGDRLRYEIAGRAAAEIEVV